MKVIAFNTTTRQPVIAFNDTTEAGIWAKLPTMDIEAAINTKDSLYGYTYRRVESLDDYPDVPSWDTQTMGERSVDAIYAMKLATSINRDGVVYDIKSTKMLTPQQIYDKYWQGLTAREIFEALIASVEKQNNMFKYMDEQKKELQQLVISQKPVNSRGEKCVYVPLDQAHELIEEIRKHDGLEGEVVEAVWEEEGYIGKHEGVCYFAVKELAQPFDWDQWKVDLNKST